MRVPDWLSMFLRTAGLRLAVLPVSSLLALATAGLTMHYAGTAAFGLILLIGQLRMALPFADLGLGAAVSRATARAGLSADSRITAARLTRLSSRVLLVVGLLGSLAALIAGHAGLWSGLVETPPGLRTPIDDVVTAALMVFFLLLPLSLAERIMVGQGRADRLVLLGLVPGVINLGHVALLGAAGVDPLWLALGLPLGKAVALLLARLLVDYPAEPVGHGPRRRVALSSAQREETDPRLLSVLRSGLPVVAATAGMVLLEQHGRMVLAVLGDAEELSLYTLALQLYMPVHSVMYMAGKVFWPRFAVDLDRSLWRRANGAMLALGAAAAIGYLTCAAPLATLVSGGEMRLPPSLTLLMALLLLAQAAHLTQTNLLTDRPGFRRQALMSGSALLVAAALTVWGVDHGLGALAPPAAMLVAVVALQVVPGLIFADRRIRRAGAPTAETPPPDTPSDHSAPSTRSIS